jgi:hypothetical protein
VLCRFKVLTIGQCTSGPVGSEGTVSCTDSEYCQHSAALVGQLRAEDYCSMGVRNCNTLAQRNKTEVSQGTGCLHTSACIHLKRVL